MQPDPHAVPPLCAAKCAEFRRLHESGCFVIPNPWDVGSARVLQHLGFRAVATTSAGFAWSMARPDNGVTLDDVLAHLRSIADAVDIPVNADFEGGFADEPESLAANVERAVAAGVAGLSIEDSTQHAEHPLHDLPLAVARIRAARAAIDRSGGGVLLTARAECYLVGRPDLKETIARLRAYAEAGADCLYAPGPRSAEDIGAIVRAVAPKPVNVLVSAPGLTVAELAALGVRRISVGGALARTAWGAFMLAAREIAEGGSFAALGRAMPHAELNGLFQQDTAARRA
jgi:2-methylisocitrate lyase-like PEP mutase family enzyme